MITSYDPNTNFDNWHKIKVTLMQHEYKRDFEVMVHGNTLGLKVLECASDLVYEYFAYNGEITLASDKGDLLICEDDEDRQEDWIADMVVAVEIVERGFKTQ